MYAIRIYYAHGAGIEQDDVSSGGIVGLLEALSAAQHVGHLARVVLVHLAAERLDVNLPGHRLCSRAQSYNFV